MASVNKTILVGHLGADPIIRYMPDGTATATIRLATTESWKSKETGDKKSHTEWHRIVSFGKQAEIIGEYLKKGAQIYIEGKLRTRKWTDKDNIERYTTEIVAEKMKMLGKKEESTTENSNKATPATPTSTAAASAAPASTGEYDPFDDDIPF